MEFLTIDYKGNTAQRTHEGFARHMLAYFPSYAPVGSALGSFDIRQYTCKIFVQSEVKSDCASNVQSCQV